MKNATLPNSVVVYDGIRFNSGWNSSESQEIRTVGPLLPSNSMRTFETTSSKAAAVSPSGSAMMR